MRLSKASVRFAYYDQIGALNIKLDIEEGVDEMYARKVRDEFAGFLRAIALDSIDTSYHPAKIQPGSVGTGKHAEDDPA